jgi:hypothetical protein
MKNRIFLKILGLTTLYLAIFATLAFVQFNDRSMFSRNIGALRISGSVNRKTAEQSRIVGDQEYAVNDDISVFFAGLEFDLSGESGNGLAYVGADGSKTAAYAEAMMFSVSEARFHLSGGQELSFYTNSEQEKTELVISATLTDEIERILIPFKIASKASVKNEEPDRLTVEYNGVEYAFGAAMIDEKSRIIALSRVDPVAFYRIVPKNDSVEFNFREFMVSGSMEKSVYNDIVQRWQGTAFAGLERRMNAAGAASNSGEAVMTAYLAEAARRGALALAVDTVPAPYKNVSVRTFLSAPLLGSLNALLRGFITSESQKTSGIASSAGSEPQDFLRDEKVFEYLAQRDNKGLFNSGIEYVEALDPAAVSLDMCAGILEGRESWSRWQDGENPFDALLPRVFTLISTHIKKDKQNTSVFVYDETVDVFYNIRLGVALTAYGEAVANNGWAAVGRSLVISALSFADSDASIGSHLELSPEGDFIKISSADTVPAALIYDELGLSEFYPHSVGFGQVMDKVWAWTASPSIDASIQDNVLDFYVSFPIGGTHYIYIFNIPPFSRIQLRNMDYRSDARFEQYDALGWLYSVQEQVLMFKMVHQASIERIRIIF